MATEPKKGTGMQGFDKIAVRDFHRSDELEEAGGLHHPLMP